MELSLLPQAKLQLIRDTAFSLVAGQKTNKIHLSVRMEPIQYPGARAIHSQVFRNLVATGSQWLTPIRW